MRTRLVATRGIARKEKIDTELSALQISDCQASRECPSCHHRSSNNSDVTVEWKDLPAGVKFDPFDVELLEHLAGKVGFGDAKPHKLVNEFIPTLESVEGICYTHPENLPGAKKDGSSVQFFHKTSKAFATGLRKRRKIHDQYEHVRWHKTGKTKCVIDNNGLLKGFKKIMVLYRCLKKGCKEEKFNWVMHQYHLGTIEDEVDSEFVVSKIFYQQHSKHMYQRDKKIVEEPVGMVKGGISSTPDTQKPDSPQPRKRALLGEIDKEHRNNSPFKVAKLIMEASQLPPEAVHFQEERAEPNLSPTNFPVAEYLDQNYMDSYPLCYGNLDSYAVNNDDMFKVDSKTACETKGEDWDLLPW